MNFNVDKCSVMQIGHNNMQRNNNMSNQQLPTTVKQRGNHHHQRPQMTKTNREKIRKGQQITGIHGLKFVGQKERK